jgi:hypothetical protein
MSAGRGDDGLVVAALAEEEETAVLERGDRGQRGIRQPGPFGLTRARLEPKLLRHPQHFRDADRHPAEAVTDLVGIGSDPVEAQCRDQGNQAWIGRIGLSAVRRHQPSHVTGADSPSGKTAGPTM